MNVAVYRDATADYTEAHSHFVEGLGAAIVSSFE